MRLKDVVTESRRASAESVLRYVQRQHHDFRMDSEILKYPHWQLRIVPLDQLNLYDVERDDPLNRVLDIDSEHIETLRREGPAGIQSRPIVVNDHGEIIDGNHRAIAAQEMGMESIPAWQPIAKNITEVFVRPGQLTKSYSAKQMVDLGIKPRRDGYYVSARDWADIVSIETGRETIQQVLARRQNTNLTEIIQKHKICENTIRDLNGVITMESWMYLIESMHTQNISETVSKKSISDIDNIVNSFGTRNLKLGHKYIPNMLLGIHDKISVYDSQGNSPGKLNQFLTLKKINGIELTFLDDQGKRVIYPDKRLSDKMYTRTVLLDNEDSFNQYRTWMQLTHDIAIPAVAKLEGKVKLFTDPGLTDLIDYDRGTVTIVKPMSVTENFADGKKPGRRGLSKRVGIPRKASLAQLSRIAGSSTGERLRMAQWQLSMRRGRAKKHK